MLPALPGADFFHPGIAEGVPGIERLEITLYGFQKQGDFIVQITGIITGDYAVSRGCGIVKSGIDALFQFHKLLFQGFPAIGARRKPQK